MTSDVYYPLKRVAIAFLRTMVSIVVPLTEAPQPPAREPAIKTTFLPSDPPSKQPLRLHVYLPSASGKGKDAARLPVVVSFVGAGFCFKGQYGSDKLFCSWLADEVGCVVVDAEYRMAPEYRWPAGPNDAHAAVLRVKELAKEHGWDAERVAVNGFSSGACLSLVEASSHGSDLKACVAFYPSTRLDQSPYDKPKVSKPKKGNAGSDVPAPVRRLLYACYLPAAKVKNKKDPRISPLYADSASFPPSVTIITCELDSLGAEGKELADKLEKERPGVCKHFLAEGQGHGWDHSAAKGTNGDDVRWTAWNLAAKRLRDAFA